MSLDNRIRIAWISYPDLISTDRFIVPEIAKKYKVDWYLISKKTDSIDFLDDIKQMSDSGLFNLNVVYISKRNYKIKTFFEFRKIIKAIKKEKYDAHFLIMMAPPFFMPLWKFIIGKKKTIVGIHNVTVPHGATHSFVEKIYTRFTINSFSFFHTFSQSQHKVFLSLAPKKRCGYSNFISMDYGESSQSRQCKLITFLSFGYIRDYKKVDCLINAAQLAYERTKILFKVIIAGSCSDWNKYQSLIKYPELFDLRIRRILNDEVSSIFKESDYFVAPYKDIAQSGSAIIAVNYDMPVIASDLPAFREYIENGKNGFFINPACETDLAEIITYILHNHTRIYKDLSENMKITKEKRFSPSAVSKMYFNTLDYILSKDR